MNRLYFALVMLFASLTGVGQVEVLRGDIQAILDKHKANIGIGILGIEGGDTLFFNGDGHYPMQSVYKFHLGLMVYDNIQKGVLRADQPIRINKSDLLPDTWSPLRDKYPNGDVVLPLGEILGYTVSQSDNNGCDILFRLIGGPLAVEKFCREKGYANLSIQATEAEMHRDWSVQFTNWTSPREAVALLRDFYLQRIVTGESYSNLWKQLVETSTGQGRLKGLLPEGTVVAHKTGSSGTNAEGVTAALNDIGIICLPNGKHIAVAVFVSNSREVTKELEGVIAEVGKAVHREFSK